MERDAVGRPMEILLVEDSLTAARLTIGALRNGGIEHRLTWLSDGNEAVAFLRREGKYARAPHPDLVLLDLMLPGRDGREVLADLRADPETSETPVVIMTGTVQTPIANALEDLSVQGFLTKPINLEAFLSLVEKLKDFWKADMILPTIPQ
jgi:two-component system, chemotaxis family, response regulator Rcp1